MFRRYVAPSFFLSTLSIFLCLVPGKTWFGFDTCPIFKLIVNFQQQKFHIVLHCIGCGQDGNGEVRVGDERGWLMERTHGECGRMQYFIFQLPECFSLDKHLLHELFENSLKNSFRQLSLLLWFSHLGLFCQLLGTGVLMASLGFFILNPLTS